MTCIPSPTKPSFSQSFENPGVILWTHLDLAKDLSNQRSRQVPTWMARNGRSPTIGMPVESMTSLLSCNDEAKLKQQSLHRPAIDNGQATHANTSIC